MNPTGVARAPWAPISPFYISLDGGFSEERKRHFATAAALQGLRVFPSLRANKVHISLKISEGEKTECHHISAATQSTVHFLR